MRAGQAVNSWAQAWRLTLCLIGIFHLLPAQAQETPTAPVERSETPRDHNPKHHHYKLINVGTFGGPEGLFSNPASIAINTRGTATGASDTSAADPYFPNCFYDCLVNHAFVWKSGATIDLGTLPGGASSFAYSINDSGVIVGQSQNGSFDPFTGYPEARGVIWRKGQIIDLGTLGGTQSNADALNDSGRVVGGALTAIPDPFANAPLGACMVLPSTLSCSGSSFAINALYFPATTETHAFLWRDGLMHDLGTLGGPDSTAYIINAAGEVTGWSYTSFVANRSSGTPTVDPFLWSPEERTMTDLGGLGGTFGAPFWINNRHQVVGISNLPGDTDAHPFLWSKSEGMQDLGTLGGTFGCATWVNDAGDVVGAANTADQINHAFLWRKGAMKDLGTVGTDMGSEAFVINSQGQVVGDSGSNDMDLHGFLWEAEGPIADLNQLVIAGSGATVVTATYISDRGEIAGTAKFPNGDSHPVPVLLIPCDDNHPNIEGCDYSPDE